MARYKPMDISPRFLAVDLERQLPPGTFHHALCYLIDHELDLSELDRRYRNDLNSAPTYPPATLLKIILFANSRGLVSSRGIERAEHEKVPALSAAGLHLRSDHRHLPGPQVPPPQNGANCRHNGLLAVKFAGAQRDCGPCELRAKCRRHPDRTKTR